MFCVIQEITTKRENPPGYPKRLEVMQESVQSEDGTERINGVIPTVMNTLNVR